MDASEGGDGAEEDNDEVALDDRGVTAAMGRMRATTICGSGAI